MDGSTIPPWNIAAAACWEAGHAITAHNGQWRCTEDHNTTETTDQSRPVVGLVAHVVDDGQALVDRIAQAIGDPGSFLPRGDDYRESVTRWSTRAVMTLVEPLLDEVEAARTADAATIGVLAAAVAKVAALHVDDGDGWCKACQTLGYPCPTVLALGAGR